MLGLAVLSLTGLSIGYGQAITFVAALLYALHIVGLGAWSDARQATGMAIVQLLVIAAVCFVATAYDGVVLPSTRADWASVLYMALFAGALAMLAQTWAQAAPASRAGGDHHEHGAGVRGDLRGAARRRVGHRPDARRRADGARGDAGRRAAPRRRIEAEVQHIAV